MFLEMQPHVKFLSSRYCYLSEERFENLTTDKNFV